MQNEEEKLWDTFSKYIRLRNADENGNVTCVTCDRKFHWKEVHAGHFMSRRHKNTKFNEKNNQVQCISCNSYNGGEQFKYGLFLDREYGEGTAQELMMLSRITCKLSDIDYREMNKEYKIKVKQLLKSL